MQGGADPNCLVMNRILSLVFLERERARGNLYFKEANCTLFFLIKEAASWRCSGSHLCRNLKYIVCVAVYTCDLPSAVYVVSERHCNVKPTTLLFVY